MNPPSRKKRKKTPVVSFRIVAVPVDDGNPFTFVLPDSVALLFARRARQLGRSVEEQVMMIADDDVKRPVVLTLEELERGHLLWREEFERTLEPGKPFRINIEVPGHYADYLRQSFLLKGTTVAEAVAMGINQAIQNLEKIKTKTNLVLMLAALLLAGTSLERYYYHQKNLSYREKVKQEHSYTASNLDSVGHHPVHPSSH
jgi:hypothetical protein